MKLVQSELLNSSRPTMTLSWIWIIIFLTTSIRTMVHFNKQNQLLLIFLFLCRQMHMRFENISIENYHIPALSLYSHRLQAIKFDKNRFEFKC